MREIIRVLGKLKMILITYHLEVNYFLHDHSAVVSM